MTFTPSPLLLKLLYNRGSLRNLPDGQGVAFSIKNRLDTARLTGLKQVTLGSVVVPASHIRLDLGGGELRGNASIDTESQAIELPVGRVITFLLSTPALTLGMHELQVEFSTDTFGELLVTVEDAIEQPRRPAPHPALGRGRLRPGRHRGPATVCRAVHGPGILAPEKLLLRPAHAARRLRAFCGGSARCRWAWPARCC
ncbi:MAG: hypothetical protein WKG07_44325 [Hymenobacter sp.]